MPRDSNMLVGQGGETKKKQPPPPQKKNADYEERCVCHYKGGDANRFSRRRAANRATKKTKGKKKKKRPKKGHLFQKNTLCQRGNSNTNAGRIKSKRQVNGAEKGGGRKSR